MHLFNERGFPEYPQSHDALIYAWFMTYVNRRNNGPDESGPSQSGVAHCPFNEIRRFNPAGSAAAEFTAAPMRSVTSQNFISGSIHILYSSLPVIPSLERAEFQHFFLSCPKRGPMTGPN
jgi:hypothetical protein